MDKSLKAAKNVRTWASSADAASKPRDDRFMNLVILRIKQRQTAERQKEQQREEPLAHAG